MKTTFYIETKPDNEDEFSIVLCKPIQMRDILDFIKDSIRVEIDENEFRTKLTFKNIKTGFSVLQTFQDLVFEMLFLTKPRLFDDKGHELRRPHGKGIIHRLQRPTPNEVFKDDDIQEEKSKDSLPEES